MHNKFSKLLIPTLSIAALIIASTGLPAQAQTNTNYVDADFGYVYSNVQNQETGNSAYNNQSFTGVLRVKF